MDKLSINRALISVTDKSGITDLGKSLSELGVELVSTGGTYKQLFNAGLEVTQVSDITGFPEVLGGRVKTLHPHIHAGIMADKDSQEHMQSLEKMGIQPFDLVCVNLYDFAGALERNLSDKELVEEIDIGGPTLLRAAAKNFHSLCVLPDPSFYQTFLQEMKENNNLVGLAFRKEAAAYAFSMTSLYDSMIARGLGTDQ